MKIGLVGEAPADTTAIKNLLLKRHPFNLFEFKAMLYGIRGNWLDDQKTKRLLRIEYEIERPDILIFIRDLDGTLKNNKTLNDRKTFFREFNRVTNKKGVFLLNIFELEALILADINTFNKYFNCNIEYSGDPMEKEEPKGFLKDNCNEYNESFNSEIFALLNFDIVCDKCRYFKGFINRFEKQISSLLTA